MQISTSRTSNCPELVALLACSDHFTSRDTSARTYTASLLKSIARIARGLRFGN